MTIVRYRPGFALGLVVALLLSMTAGTATAQDKKPEEVKKEIKVLVDDQGNVTVNGEPLEGERMELDDGTVVILDEDGKVVVLDGEEGGDRIVRKKRIMRPRGVHPGGREVRVFRMKDGDEEFEWHGDAFDREHEALARMQTLGGMLDGDHKFEFDFDFDHVNPEIMKMEAETKKLAREAARAQGSAKVEKEGQLEEKLSELFEKKLEVRRKRIERLEERLSKALSELQERERARTEIIERRKADLLGDDNLKW